jgi:nucleoside-diphosphate-sugar epimerase
MRILFTGATGVLGRTAIPQLIQAGHDVIGVTRHEQGRAWLREIGATPIALDLLEPASVGAAVDGVDAVAHFATAIPPLRDATKARAWAENDRLRSLATRVLVDAAIASSVGTFIQESVTFNYVDRGDEWIDETHTVRPLIPATGSALDAESQVFRFVAAGRRGITLRFSQLYGPGAVSAELVETIGQRRIPLVGASTNFVSNIHVDDAGSAVVAGLTAPSGIYNVTDDEPLSARDRLLLQVDGLDGPPPRRIPTPIARMFAGPSVRMLTTSQRVSNQQLRNVTGWEPRVSSIRVGWRSVAEHVVSV